MTNLQGILLLILISFKATTNTYGAIVHPIRHSLTNVRSVYGSSSNGGCTSLENNMICSLQDGGTSVLVDGTILPLSGLDGNQWARDLFTVNKIGQIYSVIGFDFGGYANVRRLELVLFNCARPFLTASRIITVYGTPADFGFPFTRDQMIGNPFVIVVGSFQLNSVDDSCDNLLRICIPISTPTQVYYVEFFGVGSNWVVLAEATFYNETTSCSDTLIPVTSPITPAEPPPVDNTEHQTSAMATESTTFTTTDRNVNNQTTDTTNTIDQNTNNSDCIDIIITNSTHTAIAWTLVAIFATLFTGSLIVNIISYNKRRLHKNDTTSYHMDDNACYGQTQMKHITTDTDTPHVYDTVQNTGI